ncbi:MAG: iron complex transport system ATP-binding protein [Gaiellaceae bacterium]|nr:iron complex transport system ATP-binding protein [Gaiellaceae bacterium]
MSIEGRDITWSAGGRLIVDGVACHVDPGSLVGVIGPNGSGKSSFLRCLAGLRTADDGVVFVAGDTISSLGRREVAKRLAFLDQETVADLPLTVLEVVMLGRTPHKRLFDRDDDRDRAIAARALAATELTGFEDRAWETLSGGERQRARIARAITQEPSILLLDEPTNHLDVSHQLQVLRLVRGLGLACLAALHDLNLAAMFCDALIVLHEGRVVATGTPAEVLTTTLVRAVYGVDCEIVTHPRTGRPVVTLDDPSL